MTIYKCKCGRVVKKATSASTTGYRDTEDCAGCPYLLPYGDYDCTEGNGYQLKVKGYECRMSKDLEYDTCFVGDIGDKNSCSVVSLDLDFLQQVNDWIADTFPDKDLMGRFSREEMRGCEFSSNGRYRYSILCAQNKRGIAAKNALFERFFAQDGKRRDMTPQEEEAKVLADIENGKNAAQQPETPTCLCVSCTCSDCHVKCYGHCNGCGKPMDACNSYQTEDCKFPEEAAAVQPPEPLAAPETDEAAPGFDMTGFDPETVHDIELAEYEYCSGKRMAEIGIRRMADGVAIAHDALCGTVATICRNGETGKFSRKKDTFSAWCTHMGINRKAAERLLQVSRLFDESTPKQEKLLEDLSPSLLYAAAKPSAPAELVEQVKNGDITTHKQYQQLLAELRQRDEKISDLIGQNEEFESRAQAAEAKAKDASARADKAFEAANRYHIQQQEAKDQRNALLDQQADYLARIAELEARPIEATAATDEEIARWKAEGAAELQELMDDTERAAHAMSDRLAAAEDKLKASQREAKRLRETLQGRTDHLDAVEAELSALKARLAKAQEALPRTDDPPALAPAPAPAGPVLVLCRDCILEPVCCGVQLMDEGSLSEEMAAGFGSALDEDAFDRRLLGCTAGLTDADKSIPHNHESR